MIKDWIVKAWYQGHPLSYLFLPLSLLFFVITEKRKWSFQRGIKVSWRAPVPVIIVGNITVGGTGKTPVVIHLVEELIKRGYRPGVISRGFGGNSESYPIAVNRGSDPHVVGDEPHLIANRTGVPLVVDPNRVRAVQYLLKNNDCNLIVSDDGLQHYALQRDIELVVVDGERGLGNGFLLPSGPLREPKSRLKKADFVVVNGTKPIKLPVAYSRMSYQTMGFFEVLSFDETSMARMNSITQVQGTVHAVAGIGNPKRFFDSLGLLGFNVVPHVFEDHHDYQEADFSFDDGSQLLLMTEKDAVKCRGFAKQNWYYLKISTQLESNVLNDLEERLGEIL
ncbi:MAG: tetraacyldisaccharide 4'-kinase [Pseudomonadales bacterium]|nr:tetraacyldisaccharide 4'-kinase [Pseudomonadales bacterium]